MILKLLNMRDPIRIKTDIKPKIIEQLGNGTYYYNYDIKLDSDEWSYIQVHLQGQPDYKKCIKTIIRQFVSQDEEFDLINSSNSIILGVSKNQIDRKNYLNYLALVEEIKTKVRSDFKIK